MGSGDPGVGHQLLYDVGSGAFVVGIKEAVQKADCDRLDTLVEKKLGRVFDIGVAKRFDFHAVPVDAPADAASQKTRHQDRRERRTVVPHVLAQAPSDLKTVAKATGGHQAGSGAFMFQKCVGRDGRTMDKERAASEQRGLVHAVVAGDPVERIKHAAAGVIGG